MWATSIKPDGVVLGGKHLRAQESRVKVRATQWGRERDMGIKGWWLKCIISEERLSPISRFFPGVAAHLSSGCEKRLGYIASLSEQFPHKRSADPADKVRHWIFVRTPRGKQKQTPKQWHHLINSALHFERSSVSPSSLSSFVRMEQNNDGGNGYGSPLKTNCFQIAPRIKWWY